MKLNEKIAAVIFAVVLALHFSGDWLVVVAPSAKPTAATYVYEKDEGAVPPTVLKGLNTLNRQNITATAFDDDTTDGSGDTPEQYKLPLAAAKEAGLPCLVVMGGDRVRKVVKAPTTEQQVTEAVR